MEQLYLQKVMDINLYIQFSDSEFREFRLALIKSAVSAI
jgi:hypothetical protein